MNNGSADIGNSSRDLKDEEKANGIAENIVAIDGIAVVVDPANAVEDLTKDQLTSIYNGTITNWKDAGGADPVSYTHLLRHIPLPSPGTWRRIPAFLKRWRRQIPRR